MKKKVAIKIKEISDMFEDLEPDISTARLLYQTAQEASRQLKMNFDDSDVAEAWSMLNESIELTEDQAKQLIKQGR